MYDILDVVADSKGQGKADICPWLCKRKLIPLERAVIPLLSESKVAFTVTTSFFNSFYVVSYRNQNDVTLIDQLKKPFYNYCS